MAEIKLFDINLDDYRSKLQSLRQELADLSQGTDEYNQKQQELADTTNELSNAVASSNPSMNELKTTMRELKQEWANSNDEAERGAIAEQIGLIEGQMKAMNQELKNTAQGAAAAEGSYNALVVQMRELQQAAKATSDEAERIELSKQANEINEKLKGMDAEMGNFQRNVGSYEESITSAFGQIAGAMGPVAKGAGGIGKAIGGLDGPIKVAVGAIGGLSKAFKALKAAMASNPIGLLITAVVAAGVAIYNHIKSVKAAEEEYNNWKKSLTDIEGATREYSQSSLIHSEALYNAAMRAKSGTDEYKNAILALQKEYPGYFSNLSTESKDITALTNDYYRLRDAIVAAAKVRGIESSLDALYKEQAKLNSEIANMDIDSFGSKMKAGWNKLWGQPTEFEKAYKKLQYVNQAIETQTENLVNAHIESQKYNTPEAKPSVSSGGGSRGGSSRGSSGGHKGGSSGSGYKQEESELEKLRKKWEESNQVVQDNLNYQKEMIDANVEGFDEYDNRITEVLDENGNKIKQSYDESASFEARQIERKKQADEQYYLNSIANNTHYYEELQKLRDNAADKAAKAKNEKDKAAAQAEVDSITSTMTEVKMATDLLNHKLAKIREQGTKEYAEQLEKEKQEVIDKILEESNNRLEVIEAENQKRIGMLRMSGYTELQLQQKEAEEQKKLLTKQLDEQTQLLYQLFSNGLMENDPLIIKTRATIASLRGELAQLKTPLEELQDEAIKITPTDILGEPEKWLKDIDLIIQKFEELGQEVPKNLKALKNMAGLMTTLQHTTNLLDNVGDAWKATVQAQLDAGKISKEEAEEQFERIKQMEIASAVVNTIAGAIGAFMQDKKAYPAPYNYIIAGIDAAATLAAGYAQIQKIKSTTIGSSGSGANSITVANATPLLDEAQDVNQLTSLNVNGDSGTNQRVYILQSDIVETTNQNKVRVEQSTF